MSNNWMFSPDKLSKEYKDGVKSLIENMLSNPNDNNNLRCPCRDCQEIYFHDLPTIKRHLLVRGVSCSYAICHNLNTQVSESLENEDEEDDMLGMVNDAFSPNSFPEQVESGQSIPERDPTKFYELFGELDQELYPGCKNFSSFQFLVKLMYVKVLNGWSNKSFGMLLQLLKDAFPEANIPVSHYESKKRLRDLGLGYEKFHACKYDCALFWKEHQNDDKCPICEEPRYKYHDKKGKNVPDNILRYFPLKPRLQRLFMSRHTAADMRWHKEKRVDTENVLRHPADGLGWKDFDQQYPWFAQDPRNVRLGLASYGFNPFGNMSNSYNMWPVVFVPYNMPPWKYMKETFFMMALLIHGPQAPGKDMDVYLRPLIDELKELWDVGVKTWDSSSKEYFQLHASVLWTINDFPAYGSLSGWSTKGYKAPNDCTLKETPKGRIELFHDTHFNSDKGGWCNPEAEIAYNKMVDLQLSNPEMSDAKICEQVLGKRPGYIKGFGFGPLPDEFRSMYRGQTSADNEALKSEVSRLIGVVESQNATILKQGEMLETYGETIQTQGALIEKCMALQAQTEATLNRMEGSA